MNEIVKNKLNHLEETAEKFWNIPPEAGNHLNLLIKACKYKTVLEVGTSNGYSAIWFAEALKETNGHLTSIEFYEERITMAKNNLNEVGLLDYVTILQGKALEIIENLNDFFDVIFIDANKAEYIKYFEKLHPKLISGGMFIADNVTSHKDDMQDFLDIFNNHPEYQVSYLPFGGGMLIGFKK